MTLVYDYITSDHYPILSISKYYKPSSNYIKNEDKYFIPNHTLTVKNKNDPITIKKTTNLICTAFNNFNICNTIHKFASIHSNNFNLNCMNTIYETFYFTINDIYIRNRLLYLKHRIKNYFIYPNYKYENDLFITIGKQIKDSIDTKNFKLTQIYIEYFNHIIENNTNNKLLQWSNTVHKNYLNNKDQLKQFYKTLRILSPFTESKLQDNNNNFIYNIFDKLDYLYDYTKDLYTNNTTMPKELQDYYQSKKIYIENDIKNDNINTHDYRCFNFINSQNILKCLKKKKNINSDDILSYKQLISIHKNSAEILYSVLYL